MQKSFWLLTSQRTEYVTPSPERALAAGVIREPDGDCIPQQQPQAPALVLVWQGRTNPYAQRNVISHLWSRHRANKEAASERRTHSTKYQLMAVAHQLTSLP